MKNPLPDSNPLSENLKTYTVLNVLGRKNPTLNAIEKTQKILNNPILNALEKIDKILSDAIYLKKITDDKKQLAIDIITNTIFFKNFFKKCRICQKSQQKTYFTIKKTTCDFCVNTADY